MNVYCITFKNIVERSGDNYWDNSEALLNKCNEIRDADPKAFIVVADLLSDSYKYSQLFASGSIHAQKYPKSLDRTQFIFGSDIKTPNELKNKLVNDKKFADDAVFHLVEILPIIDKHEILKHEQKIIDFINSIEV